MTKWWIFGVAMAIIIVSVAVIWGVAQPAPPTETAPSAEKADAAVTAAEIYGVLSVWDGKLALFCGEETPAAVYDVWIETLPEEERKKLEIGIVATSRAAFLQLLQEYTG